MSNVSANVTVSDREEILTASYLFALISDVIVGFFGQIGSLSVVVVIFSSKPLRTPCFQLIGGGAVGSLMVAAYYFGRGIDKIGELTGRMLSVERSVAVCLLTTGIEALFGIPFHALVTCFVGVDRTISVSAPIKYRSFGKKYVYYTLSGAAALVLVQEIVGFLTAPLSDVITCRDFPEALHPVFIDTFAALNLFYCTAIVTVYATMLFCFNNRKRKCKQTADYNAFMKQQSAAMPTVMMMIVLYFICGIMAEILINVAINYDGNEWAGIVMIIGDFLKATSSLVEIASLMVCCRKFRHCAKKLLGLQPNTVVVTITVSNRSAQSALK